MNRTVRLLIATAAMLLAVPTAAQAYQLTIHVHGAGVIADSASPHVTNCDTGIGSSGSYRTNSSVTDCVGGSPSGAYGIGTITTLHASVSSFESNFGWHFVKWVDTKGDGSKINCDPQDTGGDFANADCTFQIFNDLSIDVYFSDDTSPSISLGTAGPSGRVGSSSASFVFSSTDSTAQFKCTLTGPGQTGTAGGCVSGKSYSSLADGSYTFSVGAVDPSGNASGLISRNFTVDKAGPTAAISGGPTAPTNSHSAVFTFHANDADTSSYRCWLDSELPTTCTSPTTRSDVPEGAHTFHVQGVDDLGNTGAEVTRSWTADYTAPVVSLSGGPAAGSPTNSRSASFTAGSDDAGATVQCKLDDGAYGACGPLVNLADGPHTYRVHATDATGNVGAEATRTWTVDTVAPDANIASGPTPVTFDTTATFAFSAPDAARFDCRIDGGAWSPCTSPASYSAISDGPHSFDVRATDAAGNVGAGATRNWTVSPFVGRGDGVSETPPGHTTTPQTPQTPQTPSQPVAVAAHGSFKWKVKGAVTTVSRLRLTGVTKGATVTVTCTGKGCPKAPKPAKSPATGLVDLTRFFKKSKLRPGAKVTITVTAPGMTKRSVTFTTRKGKAPAGGAFR